MSTFATIKDQLQKLIDIANDKTGQTDTDLTNAVGTLAEGYGIGHGGSGGSSGSGGSDVLLQAKIVYPKHSEQVITPDAAYDGLAYVRVKPVPRLPFCEVQFGEIKPIPFIVETHIGCAVSITAE